VVEDEPGAVAAVAAYIDLNPVRARQSGKVALEREAIRRELGSRNYVNGVFEEFRGRFGERRRTGARPMRGVAALGHLMTLRNLRVDAVG